MIQWFEPLIKDPPRKGQPLYKGHFQHPQKCICNTFSTSEKRTASLQGTKWLVPKRPLLRGSTVLQVSLQCFKVQCILTFKIF